MKLKRKVQIALAAAAAAACFAAGRVSSGKCKTISDKRAISHKKTALSESVKKKNAPVSKAFSETPSKASQDLSELIQVLEELKIQNAEIAEALRTAVALQKEQPAERDKADETDKGARTAEMKAETEPAKPAEPIKTETAEPAKSAEPVKTEPDKTEDSQEPEPAEEELFIGNSQSRTFHRQECRYGINTAAAHKVTFPSAASAVSQGYKSCRRCRPAE